MRVSSGLQLSAFDARWLAEAIRLREERAGPLEDRAAVAAARAAGGDPEARIVRRAAILGECEGLSRAVASWTTRARLAMLGLCVIALASGFGAALAVLGDGARAVNVVWALGSLLGLHLLSLGLWAAGLWLGGRDAGGALGRGWLWLSSRWSRGHETFEVAQALAGLLGPARLMRWWLGAVTHGVWLAALVGALAGLLATLATRRYGFAWETTILPAEVFVRLADVLGRLPAQLGFAVPDAVAVRASGDAVVLDDATRRAWASWLVGCVVVYGVAPRLLLWGLCFGLWRVGRARLRLDPALPGYAVLAQRLTPASERIGVTDADPGRRAGPHVDRAHAVRGERAVLVGLELRGDADWPPALPPGVIDAGVLDSRDERKRLLAALSAEPPARLLIACDARQSPDRGSLELIAALSRDAGDSRVLLIGADRTEGGHAPHWRDGLLGIGMSAERIGDSIAAAFDWLGGMRAEHGNA